MAEEDRTDGAGTEHTENLALARRRAQTMRRLARVAGAPSVLRDLIALDDEVTRLSTILDAEKTLPGMFDAIESLHSLKTVLAYARDERGFCCEVGCGYGGCDACPCCSAGYCVMGVDDLPDDPEELAHWISVAREHNPVVAHLTVSTDDGSGGASTTA